MAELVPSAMSQGAALTRGGEGGGGGEVTARPSCVTQSRSLTLRHSQLELTWNFAPLVTSYRNCNSVASDTPRLNLGLTQELSLCS